MRQPTLFEGETESREVDDRALVLYALGDFQARGKVLAGRDLPLDRLRGALKRAADTFGVAELTDERAVAALGALGANVRRVPSFVAKHPFRVVTPVELAEQSSREYVATTKKSGGGVGG